MTQHVGEEWSRLTASTRSRTCRHDQPGQLAKVLPYRAQSGRSVVQTVRARSIQTLTAAARPTEPVAAACTAWGAAAADDARAREPAR